MLNQEYHKSQYLDLYFFNIFIFDLFFDDIDIDLANYADDTTPYAYDLELDKVIESLEKNIDKLFHWFSDNFTKNFLCLLFFIASSNNNFFFLFPEIGDKRCSIFGVIAHKFRVYH